MVLSAFVWAIISAATAACYNVFLKKSSEKFLFSFWVAFLTFIGMTIAFYQKNLSEGMSLSSVTSHMSTLTYENHLNYIIVSLLIVSSVALKAHLFNKFSLAKIIPILQIGTPLTGFLYFLLGDQLTTREVLGIGILSCGAFISGFERFHFPNIFKPLMHLPSYLYLGGASMALLGTTENLIIYLTTEITDHTTKVINFFHAHGLTYFTARFVTPLEYFQMSSLFVVSFLFLYLTLCAKNPLSAFLRELKEQKQFIIPASIANFFSQYLYYYIYQGNDQAVVVALGKFSVPLTLALAYITMHEKIHLPELVGVSLILIGGIIGAS